MTANSIANASEPISHTVSGAGPEELFQSLTIPRSRLLSDFEMNNVLTCYVAADCSRAIAIEFEIVASIATDQNERDSENRAVFVSGSNDHDAQ